MSSTTVSILDRLRTAWNSLTGSGRGRLALRPELPSQDQERLREQMRECLTGKGGEVSARARAAVLGEAYLGLNDEGRQRFLEILAGDFAIDRAAVREAAHALDTESDLGGDLAHILEAEATLRDLLTPPHMTLLTQFNALPQGVKFLVDMRADLRRFCKGSPLLAHLDTDLQRQLSSWFDIGFLELRRITWDAPAALLEKLVQYEAVHEIRSWEDLKNRLRPDRRCFAFFHPRMPDEPLIFVEVALVPEIAGNIHTLLDETTPEHDVQQASTAIFYSISTTQPGLRGVSLGNFLIKRVVDYLVHDLPHLKTFATLSPIPGFREYFERVLEAGAEELFTDARYRQFRKANPDADIAALIADDEWRSDPELVEALRTPLLRCCARYLLEEKRGDHAQNSVAHFHLSNGALIERINWLGDTSENGMRTSLGLMVNYLYKLTEIDGNHEAYKGSGEISASKSVRALVDKVDKVDKGNGATLKAAAQ